MLRTLLHAEPSSRIRGMGAFAVTLLSFGLLLPLSGRPHDLQAPETVEARIDGSFSYEWVFTAGPRSALIEGSGWDALANVSGGLHGDCFCVPDICLLKEGEKTTFTVNGNLQDPSQNGFVRNWVFLCEEAGVNVTTVILPFGTMPLGVNTWSRIKALYR